MANDLGNGKVTHNGSKRKGGEQKQEDSKFQWRDGVADDVGDESEIAEADCDEERDGTVHEVFIVCEAVGSRLGSLQRCELAL